MSASIQEFHDFLETVRIPVRLAVRTESGWPLVLSLWFLHRDGLLYCATQKSARVVGYLKNDPRCAFEIAADLPPYCGVRGQARARIDEALGAAVLKGLLVRYLGDTQNELAKQLLAKSQTEVAIVLKPQSVYTWDFTDRMAESHSGNAPVKVCP